jgi:hypothetical protein
MQRAPEMKKPMTSRSRAITTLALVRLFLYCFLSYLLTFMLTARELHLGWAIVGTDSSKSGWFKAKEWPL